MPKLPGLKQQVRVGPGSTANVVSPQTDQAEGLRRLGGSVMRLASALGKSGKSNFNQAAKNAAILGSQNVLGALDDPRSDVSADGTNYVDLYDQGMKQAFDDYVEKSGLSGQKLSDAKIQFDTAKLAQRQKAIARRDILVTSNQLRDLDINLDQIATTVANDPDLYFEKRDEAFELVENSLLKREAQDKVLATTVKDLQKAGLSFYLNREDFEGARGFINGSLRDDIGGEEAEKLLNKVEQWDVKITNKRHIRSERNRKELEREERENSERLFSQYLGQARSDDDFEKKTALIEAERLAATGVFSRNQLQAIESASEGVLKSISDRTEFKLNNLLVRKRTKGFEAKVTRALENKDLTSSAGTRLMNRYNSIKEKKGSDGVSKGAKLRLAQKQLNKLLPVDEYDSESLDKNIRANEVLIKSFEQGASSTKALQDAVRSVDPNHGFLNENITAPADPTQLQKQLRKEVAKDIRFLKKNKAKMSKKEKQKMLQNIRNKKNKLRGLENRKLPEKIFKEKQGSGQ